MTHTTHRAGINSRCRRTLPQTAQSPSAGCAGRSTIEFGALALDPPQSGRAGVGAVPLSQPCGSARLECVRRPRVGKQAAVEPATAAPQLAGRRERRDWQAIGRSDWATTPGNTSDSHANMRSIARARLHAHAARSPPDPGSWSAGSTRRSSWATARISSGGRRSGGRHPSRPVGVR
jgi:hypothetical protein